MKLERNDMCICGNGKKNKNCCNLQEINDNEFYDLIIKFSNQTLAFDEQLLIQSIDRLETFLKLSHLSVNNKSQILLNLIGAYQRRGLHKKALDVIAIKENEGGKPSLHLKTYLILLKAKSLSSLENFELACNNLDGVIDNLLSAKDNSEGAGLFLVEASKIYINGNQIPKAKTCLEKSINILKDEKKEIEHYQRAKSNLAILMLHDEDEKVVEKGVELINESIYVKSEIGDLEGLGTNYCNLGLHYWRKKDYKGAIAYLRKDLWITRKIGDLYSIAISLRNLTALYIVLKQITQARKLVNESIEIGKQLNDDAVIEKASYQLQQINNIGKLAGATKENIGQNSPCLCGSGNTYINCCGVADHEPIDFPFRFSGVSEELKGITNKFKQPSRLDFIFRDSKESEGRLSWNRVEINNGWYKLSELPDMANIYLLSAKDILKDIEKDENSIHKPLSCLILSVCALEAYINQVAYFLDDVRKYPESIFHNIPEEFNNGVADFQRNTELTLKWSLLGENICEEMWTPSQTDWNNFKLLISIRNEFIHFKLSDYEQVIPVPKELHSILRKMPKSVEIRNVFHAWPMRILTPSFAKWSVETADGMIKYFKKQYENKRIKST